MHTTTTSAINHKECCLNISNLFGRDCLACPSASVCSKFACVCWHNKSIIYGTRRDWTRRVTLSSCSFHACLFLFLLGTTLVIDFSFIIRRRSRCEKFLQTSKHQSYTTCLCLSTSTHTHPHRHRHTPDQSNLLRPPPQDFDGV